MANQKLELTWYGKEDSKAIEPRILVEDEKLSNITYDEQTGNMLIHGDNLLALKALEQKYANEIKCIYLDPPYNTGAAFEHYDDNLQHSIWLSLMRERLCILRNLLRSDGVIFIQIDYNEQAYLKVLMDEIFERSNYLTMITCKVKAPSGIASGANAFFDCSEYILAYAKNKKDFRFNVTKVDSVIIGPSSPTVTNVYNQLIEKWNDNFQNFSTFEDDVDICEMKSEDFKVSTIKKNSRTEEVYYNNYKKIFRIAAISGGRDKKILAYLQSLPNYNRENIYSYSYIASQGKNKGKRITNYIYKGGNILFLKDFVRVDDEKKQVYKQDIITNIFTNDWWQGLTGEGGVSFKNGQKPEKLIQTLLTVVTNEGDIVLDSFLGSGTTSAVAHKMNRKWIGIEMGNQAYDLCKIRLDNIIKGEDRTGISKSAGWTFGGGYRFYELAPSLIQEDNFGQAIINSNYNANMLAAAIAKHEGYNYNPDASCYWKQSKNDNNSFLFVTTQHINMSIVESIKTELKDDEFLLIVCKSYDSNCNLGNKNIIIKKIPQSLLNNCEFGVDNYNLNIINPPVYEEDEEDEE